MDIANNDDEVNPMEKTLEAGLLHDEDTTAFSSNATTDESFEKNSKNPLLLSPVIRCFLKFLSVQDIKNCRLVCREWGSTGKLALASRAAIRFTTRGVGRSPVDFRSCFQNSATLFSAFDISGDFTSKTLEELAKFFGEEQKNVKELSIKGFPADRFGEKVVLSSWLPKSSMVQKDFKHLTKLSIENFGCGDNKLVVPPLHLIAHIKDLTISNCRIDLETGIKIYPTKLKLWNAIFFREGAELNQIRINDAVDLKEAKEVSLQCRGSTKYVLDLWGKTTLENLSLKGCEILNGRTSQWIIKHLAMTNIPYSLNSLMNIKELSLSNANLIDLFTLPATIQKLALYLISDIPTTVICSHPIAFENLQYLHIAWSCRQCMATFMTPGHRHRQGHQQIPRTYCSFLSHFANCPQLTHLKLNRCNSTLSKPLLIPQSVETLTLEYSIINWLKDCSFNLKKLICNGHGRFSAAQLPSKSKIKIEDLVLNFWDMAPDQDLLDIVQNRKHICFFKRIYIGKLKWHKGNLLQNSCFKDLVDAESSFYVFENGEKGRALSETAFHDLIPKHLINVPLQM